MIFELSLGKLPGRVGDSPLLGQVHDCQKLICFTLTCFARLISSTKSPLLQFQGVFADDFSVAVSCTGTGETFMRAGVARRAAYLVRVSFCLWLENRSSFGHNSYLQVEDQGLSAQEASQAALDYMKSRWFLSIKFCFLFQLTN